jgi:predicted Zn-dependent protease with MMP-like domain
VPRSRTPAEQFDDLVLDAVEELEASGPEGLAAELADVEFAVEEVPQVALPGTPRDLAEAADALIDRGVPLGRIYRDRTPAMIVVYRRPIEARAAGAEDRADLVFSVIAELVADLLGRDIEDIDPGG